MKGKNSGFKLKDTYNGIQLAFGSKVILSNVSLTDELAVKAIREHPLGEGLFAELPRSFDLGGLEETDDAHLKTEVSDEEPKQLTPESRKVELEGMDRKDLQALAKRYNDIPGNKSNDFIITEILKKEFS